MGKVRKGYTYHYPSCQETFTRQCIFPSLFTFSNFYSGLFNKQKKGGKYTFFTLNHSVPKENMLKLFWTHSFVADSLRKTNFTPYSLFSMFFFQWRSGYDDLTVLLVVRE